MSNRFGESSLSKIISKGSEIVPTSRQASTNPLALTNVSETSATTEVRKVSKLDIGYLQFPICQGKRPEIRMMTQEKEPKMKQIPQFAAVRKSYWSNKSDDSDSGSVSSMSGIKNVLSRKVEDGDNISINSLGTDERLSENVHKLLMDKRSKITYGGPYKERYKNEFEAPRRNYNEPSVRTSMKGILCSSSNNNSRDLESYKLVQNVERLPNKDIEQRKVVEIPRQPKPVNCIDLRQLEAKHSIPVNLKAHLISSSPRCQTPNFEPNQKDSKERVNSIDVLSEIEKHINSIEANTKLGNIKDDSSEPSTPKPNLYGEHENLLKPGISDLVSDVNGDFNKNLTKVRNSTGGVEQLNTEKQLAPRAIKLSRTASDTQDRPIQKSVIKRQMHYANNRNVPQVTIHETQNLSILLY